MEAILSSSRFNDYAVTDLKRVDLKAEIQGFLQSADNCHNYARSTPP
ncbi:MAG: hypothetical protein RL130_144 [Actinomycetota bacterium]|jgi:hypothetical protein